MGREKWKHNFFQGISCKDKERNDAILEDEVSQERFMFICLMVGSHGEVRPVLMLIGISY